MTLLEQYMADYQRVCAEMVALKEQLETAVRERDEHQRARGLLFRDLERLQNALREIERGDCRPLLGRLMGPMDTQGIARRALGDSSHSKELRVASSKPLAPPQNPSYVGTPDSVDSNPASEGVSGQSAVHPGSASSGESSPASSRAEPPAPDPCLVSLKGSELRNPSEKEWREARNCPRGCGEVCADSNQDKEPNTFHGSGKVWTAPVEDPS